MLHTHLVKLPQILFLCLVDDSKNSGNGLAHNTTRETKDIYNHEVVTELKSACKHQGHVHTNTFLVKTTFFCFGLTPTQSAFQLTKMYLFRKKKVDKVANAFFTSQCAL